VWVGNDNGKPMIRTTGGSLPAEIWNQIMRVAHQGLPSAPLPGTVVSRPEVDDAVLPVDEAAHVSKAPSAPRVVQYHEALPLAPRDAAQRIAPPRVAEKTADIQPPPQAHPTSNIDDDFIARALADELEQQRDAMPDQEPVEARPGVAAFAIGAR
ncbi:MAG: penicillin-binding protein, partial [Hyphomicrobium denitrificans]|nr:penicillin-binding protein [Hyphomicrobium denitrificans]